MNLFENKNFSQYCEHVKTLVEFSKNKNDEDKIIRLKEYIQITNNLIITLTNTLADLSENKSPNTVEFIKKANEELIKYNTIKTKSIIVYKALETLKNKDH